MKRLRAMGEVSRGALVGKEVVLLQRSHASQGLAVVDPQLLAPERLAPLVDGFRDLELPHFVARGNASLSDGRQVQGSFARSAQQARDRVVKHARALDLGFDFLVAYRLGHELGVGGIRPHSPSNGVVVLSDCGVEARTLAFSPFNLRFSLHVSSSPFSNLT